MTPHIVNIDALTGMKCTGFTMTSCSRAADTAEMTFLLDDVQSDLPWNFGDRVEVLAAGRAIFYGYVTEPPNFAFSATRRTASVKLGNIVALLDVVPYTEMQSFKDILKNEERIADAQEIIEQLYERGCYEPGGTPAPERAVVELPDSSIVCPTGSGSQSCWSLIMSCLHWVPDAVTWFDHSSRTLYFRKAHIGDTVYIDLNEKRVYKRTGAVQNLLFDFAGAESFSFRPRHDLCPPAVGINWTETNVAKTFPEGASLAQPWAFLYQVPGIGGDSSVPDTKPVQEAASERMEIRGLKVRDGWQLNGNMKTIFPTPEENRKFWAHFASCDIMRKTSADCLQFGTPIFIPVPVEDAFPNTDELEETKPPANYKMFEPGDSIFVMTKGSFPASSKDGENLPLLKFCRGKLKQYVWLRQDYIGEATKEEFDLFFKGCDKFEPASGATPEKSRYALLEMDAVFINRSHKRYRTGTNKLEKGDEDYDENDSGGDDVSDEVSASLLEKTAEDFYYSTRQLFYDGEIALRGVDGYDPAMFNGANLCIIGGRQDWERMETPIVQAVWNPFFKTLELSTGSPEILTFDERLQRQQIGRHTAAGAGTSFAKVTPAREDGDDDKEQYSMVSPSINMTVGITATGKFMNPFQVYQDGDKWFMNEGVLPTPTGMIIFPTTDITELKAKFSKVTAVPEFDFTEKKWKISVKGFN